MALLFADSFDHYDPGNDTEQLLKGYRTSTAGMTTTTGRDGVGSALNLNNVNQFLEYATGTKDELTIGFACYLVAKPTVNGQIVTFNNPAFSGFGLTFYINPAGQITADAFNTVIKASSKSLPVGQWCYLEFQGTNHDTTGSFEARLNGETILSATGVDTVAFGAVQTGSITIEGTAVDMYIDDLYILDDTGTDATTFLGEIKVSATYADGDSSANWTATGAGTSNADRVSEAANDGDTTYVESGTTGQHDKYTYAAVDTDFDTIYAVQSVSLAKFIDDGGSRDWRHIADSSASEDLGATHALTASYAYYTDMHENDPNGGGAWTPTSVNAAVFGFEVV